MRISSAFAWTKGNFIESKIAEVCVDLNFSYKKAKAGLTWDYLQFIQSDTKNFDIAHELGHLLLHYRVEFTSLDRKVHKAIENEANQFASAFLLPEERFLTDMQTIAHVTNPDAYIDLKKKWKTSLQVLGYRAAKLGIMDAKNHRNFYAALHRKGYLKIEPLDETIPIQKPQKVKSIVDLVAKKGMIDIRQMIENDWKVEIAFFHRITGIDLSFFNRYMVSERDFDLSNVTGISSRYS